MVTYSVCTRHLLAYFHRFGLAGTLYHCMSLEQETRTESERSQIETLIAICFLKHCVCMYWGNQNAASLVVTY